MVTGRVERGIIKVQEEVEIVGIKATTKTTCTGVEMFRKLLDEGRAGENVGILLRGNALRSSLPFGLSGIRSSASHCAGTMYSGRLVARCAASASRQSPPSLSSTT